MGILETKHLFANTIQRNNFYKVKAIKFYMFIYLFKIKRENKKHQQIRAKKKIRLNLVRKETEN